jgi:stearoyl-CoA desaturase (delta-9 desaturase)
MCLHKTPDATEKATWLSSCNRVQRWIDTAHLPFCLYLVVIHFMAAWGVSVIGSCEPMTLAWAFIMYIIGGFGITVGAHRLWSHRSYKATFSLRVIMMVFNSVAAQGTIFHWARDHRVHHKHSETKRDPHNAARGFFYAHVGWLMLKKEECVKEAGRKLDMSDLEADSVVAFQKRYGVLCQVFWAFIFPTFVAAKLWNEDMLNAFLVAGMLKYVVTLHFTWCVNSVAHMWGDRPYDPHQNPAENLAVAIGALGEGWHNWHHAFPYDYACSELGISKQFNPSKLLIDTFAAIGLAYDRKTATQIWERRKRKTAQATPQPDHIPLPPLASVSPAKHLR